MNDAETPVFINEEQYQKKHNRKLGQAHAAKTRRLKAENEKLEQEKLKLEQEIAARDVPEFLDFDSDELTKEQREWALSKINAPLDVFEDCSSQIQIAEKACNYLKELNKEKPLNNEKPASVLYLFERDVPSNLTEKEKEYALMNEEDKLKARKDFFAKMREDWPRN